jgi:large subunit ribosomal protein L10
LPTEKKIQSVEQVRGLIEGCTIAISTDFTGMTVGAMVELRRALGETGAVFRVVKNSIANLAADGAGKPHVKAIIEGPTGIAFGFDDPVGPAKALAAFIRTAKSPLRIKGGVLGERLLTVEEINALAALPGKDAMVARLMGQLQGPITGLAYVLNGPVSALARVLQRRIEAVSSTTVEN